MRRVRPRPSGPAAPHPRPGASRREGAVNTDRRFGEPTAAMIRAHPGHGRAVGGTGAGVVGAGPDDARAGSADGAPVAGMRPDHRCGRFAEPAIRVHGPFPAGRPGPGMRRGRPGRPRAHTPHRAALVVRSWDLLGAKRRRRPGWRLLDPLPAFAADPSRAAIRPLPRLRQGWNTFALLELMPEVARWLRHSVCRVGAARARRFRPA